MTDLVGLVAECEARGIRFLPAGDGTLTLDASRGALTPDLVNWLKAHKAELLDYLRMWGDCRPVDWRRLQSLDPSELEPCPRCGSLELWQTLAGTWRCLHCDHDVLERYPKLADRAARLRRGERLPTLRGQQQTAIPREIPATTAEHNGENARPEVQSTLFEGISSRPKSRRWQR